MNRIPPNDRSVEIERLNHLPPTLRERPQWLLWKYEQGSAASKPRKVPYYASGHRRSGEQGTERDRARLVSFEVALQRLQGIASWEGIGYAFLPGDGLIGIDIDHAIDQESGEIDDRWRRVIANCASYTERSVSGEGVHIIVQGETTTTKDDSLGLELYCGAQYFCCTGRVWEGTPADVTPIRAEVLAGLRRMIEDARDQTRALKAAAQDGQPPAARTVVPLRAASSRPDDDFARVNRAALDSLDAWVPSLFPSAKKQPGTGAYRIRSRDLGRELEEDLSIHPDGIMDWGERRGLTAIDIVIAAQGTSPRAALQWLADRIGVSVRRSSPPVGAASGAASAASATGKAGGKIDAMLLASLCENFALIYGTDTVWDAQARVIMPLSAMSHAWGGDAVRVWKSGVASPRRSDGGRWTVLPTHVVFDPACETDPDTHVNLFGGLKMKPVAGDVRPMIDLLTHLTSRVSTNPDECEEIRHWLLCWLAYPLQHVGAKLRTAIVMHGDEGAGKNFLTDTMVAIYGEYGVTVGQDELEDRFNEWRSKKLFVAADEVSSRADLVHNKNRLKGMVASSTVQINPKGLPRREEANHANLFFNSNEQQAMVLDNSDRRYTVIYTPGAKDFDYYKGLLAWRAAGGTQAFLHYLLEYPLDGFEPYAPAPTTVAKEELIDMGRKSPERFWLEWQSGQIDLPYRSCTLAQAYKAYRKYAHRNGDKWPATRPLFTRLVFRIADTYKKSCVEKIMRVDYSRGDIPHWVSTRMFLVLAPPETEQGVFATECYRQFEPELRHYLGLNSRFDEDEREGSD